MYLFWFIAFLFSIISMTKNCFGSALAAIVSEGIMKKSQTGLISAAFYMAYGPLQPVGGILADKFNPKKLVSLGVAGAAIANTVIFFNHNYYVMLCAWFLNGVSQLALYPGLFKPIMLRNSRYNHHLGKGASIIEVGATGNTMEQCLTSMKYLAKVVSEVMK